LSLCWSAYLMGVSVNVFDSCVSALQHFSVYLFVSKSVGLLIGLFESLPAYLSVSHSIFSLFVRLPKFYSIHPRK
jgi:hypothetical protein